MINASETTAGENFAAPYRGPVEAIRVCFVSAYSKLYKICKKMEGKSFKSRLSGLRLSTIRNDIIYLVSGRASRSEFWWFVLLDAFLQTIASIFNPYWRQFIGVSEFGKIWQEVLLGDLVGFIFATLLALPLVTVAVRRLHDIGRSGWNILFFATVIGIPVLIYWWSQPGGSFKNRYNL